MESKLFVQNIVLVGQFTPNFFDKYFFIKNNIFNESDFFGKGFVDVIDGHQFLASDYHFIIQSTQIILSNHNVDSTKQRLTIDKIAAIMINQGQEGFISAMGLNFNWHLNSNESLHETTKKYFFNKDIKVFSKFFDNEKAYYGVYASKEFNGARLKLDIKPTTVTNNLEKTISELVVFNFNFHIEVKDQKETAEDILNYINNYNDFFNESKKIVKSYQD